MRIRRPLVLKEPGEIPTFPDDNSPLPLPINDEPLDPPESSDDINTGNVEWEVFSNGQDFIQIDEIHGDRYVQIVMNPDGMIIMQDQDGNRIERPDAGWGFFAGWNGDNGWGNDQIS